LDRHTKELGSIVAPRRRPELPQLGSTLGSKRNGLGANPLERKLRPFALFGAIRLHQATPFFSFDTDFASVVDVCRH